MQQHTFTVSAKSRFPIDMLRHDACWPMTEIDAGLIEQSHHPEEYPRAVRRITLATLNPHAPTVERWASFNWSVKR